MFQLSIVETVRRPAQGGASTPRVNADRLQTIASRGRGAWKMWLALVRQRCLKRSIERSPSMMSPAECVKLLDAAMCSHGPACYLAGVQRSFEDAGREGDASVTSALRALIEADEIEVVMSMRAEWLGLRTLLQSRSGLGL